MKSEELDFVINDLILGRCRIRGKSVTMTRHELAIFYLLGSSPSVELSTFQKMIWNGKKNARNVGVQLFNVRAKLRKVGIRILFDPEIKAYRMTGLGE